MLSLTSKYADATSAELLPLLKQYEPQYRKVKTDAVDTFVRDITSGAVYMAIERMISSIAQRTTAGLDWQAQAIAAQMVEGTDDLTAETLQKSIDAAYGIDITQILRAQNIAPTLQMAQKINVGLIKTIPAQYFGKLSDVVSRGVQQGQRYEDIADEIQNLYGVTDSRAKLIARDQTAKTNAAITQTRQEDLGINKYRWITAGDERVRETHAANEGEIFSWDDPPAETGHPGTDINCFPGETRVAWANGVSKVYRRHYDGPLVEIVTDTGALLQATPNHPIQTPRGWQAAGDLEVGDFVLQIVDESLDELTEAFDPGFVSMPESVSLFTIFGQARDHGHVDEIGVSSASFHGDGVDDGLAQVATPDIRLSFGRPPVGATRSVRAASVISRRSYTYNGLVYNLETTSGQYAASAIVVSNCRCVAAPIIGGEDDEEGD